MRALHALLFAVLATTQLCAPGRSAIISHKPVEGDRHLILVSGDIEVGDDSTFRALSLKHPSAIVALDSAGGALVPAIEIGKMIRLQGNPTIVASGSICTSACALMWVAGSKRYLSPNGRVGFHASYLTKNGRTEETGLGNALVGRYLTLLNLPEKAVVFATMASPIEIEWLTPSNMEEAGIEFESFPDSPTKLPSSVEIDREPSRSGWRVAGVGVCARECKERELRPGAVSSIFFVDAGSVRRSGDKVVFWYETRGKKPSRGINRYIALTEAECPTRGYRYLKYAAYLDRERVSSGAISKLQYAIVDDLMGVTINAACNGQYYTGTIDDRAAYAVRLFARR